MHSRWPLRVDYTTRFVAAASSDWGRSRS